MYIDFLNTTKKILFINFWICNHYRFFKFFCNEKSIVYNIILLAILSPGIFAKYFIMHGDSIYSRIFGMGIPFFLDHEGVGIPNLLEYLVRGYQIFRGAK